MCRKYGVIVKIIFIFLLIIFYMFNVWAEEKIEVTQDMYGWQPDQINNFINTKCKGGFPAHFPDELKNVWAGNFYMNDQMPPDCLLPNAEKIQLTPTEQAKATESLQKGPPKTSDQIQGEMELNGDKSEEAIKDYLEAIEDEVTPDASGTAIYKNPEVIKSASASDSLEDVINDADIFEKGANKEHVKSSNLQNFSGVLFSIFFQIGIAVAVIVGGIIGIKFMMSSVEEKASIKELLVPYIFGCVVVFGAFGIWKIAVNIFSNL